MSWGKNLGIQKTAGEFHIVFPGKHLGRSSRTQNSWGGVNPSHLCLPGNHPRLLTAVASTTKPLPKLPQRLLLPRQSPDVPDVALLEQPWATGRLEQVLRSLAPVPRGGLRKVED